ncbi:MAG TPA: protein translocase subunit SecF [Candidatus Omnitrophica bacterium]|nr:protein translocase subunit SecF [Candidatus Omnitrophota bacterium]
MRFLKATNIDFMRYRKIAFLISSSLIVIGLIAFFIRGKTIFGIDFTGGTLIRYKFQQTVDVGDIRTALERGGVEKSIIQSYDGGRGILVRTSGERRKEIEEIIQSNFSSSVPKVVEERTIGPVVGELLKRKALFAVIFAMIGILLYIGWRFEFKFGFCAVVCLIHDVLFTIGIFALTGREISLPVVAAFLTIVGYSLNDTIVVFDRIRENLKISRRKLHPSIVNSSINQVLSRSVITSLTTLLTVLTLLFLGGAVVRDFAFALAIGIVIGTYSSVYIASPLLMGMERRLKSRV